MRLKVLGGYAIETLYGRPRFTHEERVEHFALSPAEVAALEQLHSIKSKIFFILQLGYFKARHMFFVFDLREVEDDVGYIRERYFPDADQVDPTITKGTRAAGAEDQRPVSPSGSARGRRDREGKCYRIR